MASPFFIFSKFVTGVTPRRASCCSLRQASSLLPRQQFPSPAPEIMALQVFCRGCSLILQTDIQFLLVHCAASGKDESVSGFVLVGFKTENCLPAPRFIYRLNVPVRTVRVLTQNPCLRFAVRCFSVSCFLQCL